jgi:hypothetical protein
MTNIIERQADFGRTLFEINQNTIQELAQSTQANFKKYFELNSDFGKKLPEVTDISSYVELQREYGETLWSDIKEASQARSEILKSAVEETGEAVRKVFATES